MLANDAPRPPRTERARSLARMALGDGEELMELREEVRRLGEELERARERERRRIAREMHDSTVQDLVAIGLMLRRLEDLVDPPAAKEILSEVRTILAATQQDLRTLSFLLHPPVVDSEGLIVALHALIRGLSTRMKTRVDLECEELDLRIAPELEHELYKVVQEALINVHKHARASRAVVRLAFRDDCLILEIEDDGIGLDDCETAACSGVGLEGMRQRLEEFGGLLTISSRGRGLIVRAEVPIEMSGAAAAGKDRALSLLRWNACSR